MTLGYVLSSIIESHYLSQGIWLSCFVQSTCGESTLVSTYGEYKSTTLKDYQPFCVTKNYHLFQTLVKVEPHESNRELTLEDICHNEITKTMLLPDHIGIGFAAYYYRVPIPRVRQFITYLVHHMSGSLLRINSLRQLATILCEQERLLISDNRDKLLKWE